VTFANAVPFQLRSEARSPGSSCPDRFTSCPVTNSRASRSSAVDAARLKVLTRPPDDSDGLVSLVVLSERTGTHRWTWEFTVGWDHADGGPLDAGMRVAPNWIR
jgi:hypothetical protein